MIPVCYGFYNLSSSESMINESKREKLLASNLKIRSLALRSENGTVLYLKQQQENEIGKLQSPPILK